MQSSTFFPWAGACTLAAVLSFGQSACQTDGDVLAGTADGGGPSPGPGVYGVDGASPDVAVAANEAGSDAPTNQPSEGWSVVANSDTNDLKGVWGTATDAWAVGALGTVLHFDGSAWSRRADVQITTTNFVAVWGSDPANVWAIGNDMSTGKYVRYDGTQWSIPLNLGLVSLRGIWGSSASDITIVADTGSNNAYRWTGGPSWSPFPNDRGPLLGVSGSGPTDMTAIGSGGVLMRSNGAGWQVADPPLPTAPSGGIWAGGELWITALNGVVYSRVTGAWSSAPTGTASTFRAITKTSNGVWAVGDGGVIGHYLNGSWTLTTTVTNQSLFGIYAASATDIWAVGDKGTILHYGP